jgi:hypothetical protein
LGQTNESLRRGTVEVHGEDFPDPLIPFKSAFSQLLAPKELVDPVLKDQILNFRDGTSQYPLASLSSGEREVVNVVFDFLLRNPTDCIVVFDEPELHLHPELSYKLIQTLKNSGFRNQFLFCTHSADIISASLDNSVVFISPAKDSTNNQAIVVSEEDETHRALKLVGQSIGIVALGKKIVLIEGEHGSLDKQTYGAILKNKFPNLVLVPSGGRGLIQSFSFLADEVLEKSLWGVQFFMLCDRDAVPATKIATELEAKSLGKLRLLGRYHLENYFLEEAVIAEIFADFEAETSWRRSQDQIRARLLEIAREQLSYAAALIVSAVFRERVGNLSIMPKDCNGKSAEELVKILLDATSRERTRIESTIDSKEIEEYTVETMGAAWSGVSAIVRSGRA